MNLKHLFLLAGIFISHISYGQTPKLNPSIPDAPEKAYYTVIPPPKDTIRYHLNAMTTGIINNTNSGNSYILNNVLKFTLSKKLVSLDLSGSWVYGKTAGILTNNDISGAADVSFLRSVHRLYYWGLADYTSSVSLNIISQFQAGGGIAYGIISTKHANLILSDGLLYEKGDLYDSLYSRNGNIYQHDIYQVGRNSFRLSYHWAISQLLTLDGTGFFQNSLSAFNDYVINTNQTASVRLKKWLSFTTSLAYNRFTRTNRENSIFSFGMTIDKRF